jgi:protein tyrosine phosphatase
MNFKSKNRYAEILPFIHNQIKLSKQNEDAPSFFDYINAGYVNSNINTESKRRAYIVG